MHAFVFWPCLSTNSTTAVAVPKSQTAQSTSSLPLPPNWSSTCLEGCLKFCHRDLRIIPQFTLTSFIRRNWTKLINNGTAEIERTSPRESTGFFFFFWQCLIADERVKKKNVLGQNVSKPFCTQVASVGCPMDRARLIGSHPAVSVMGSIPWYLESSAGLCWWQSTSCWPSGLGRGLHLTSWPG